MQMKNKRETLIDQYTPEVEKINVPSWRDSIHSTSKGPSLEEFYREVFTLSRKNGTNLYQNKNAAEIETLMRNNRLQIESRRSGSR